MLSRDGARRCPVLLSRWASKRGGADILASRTTLGSLASQLLGLAIGMRLAAMREVGEPFLAAAGMAEEQSVLIRLADEIRIRRPELGPAGRPARGPLMNLS